jgi:uncharacterized Tic20 family protein
MNPKPSTEERIWAVISHLSALLLGMGILLPIVGWAEQRQKSKYASFQCLQALGYQSLGYTVWILAALVILVIESFTLLSQMIAAAEQNADFDSLVAIGMGGNLLLLGLIGVYVFLPIVGAVACAFGREFHYPILGRRLGRYVEYEGDGLLHEEHQDRFVAAMGHFSVIIALWGMLAPLTAWILQGKRSQFLKFQSIQTLVFQAGTILMYFFAAFIYMLGFVAFIAATGLAGNPQVDSSAGLISLLLFIVFSLIAILIIVAIPLLHILGQWAGYRVLKGDEYLYPIIGKIIKTRMK